MWWFREIPTYGITTSGVWTALWFWCWAFYKILKESGEDCEKFEERSEREPQSIAACHGTQETCWLHIRLVRTQDGTAEVNFVPHAVYLSPEAYFCNELRWLDFWTSWDLTPGSVACFSNRYLQIFSMQSLWVHRGLLVLERNLCYAARDLEWWAPQWQVWSTTSQCWKCVLFSRVDLA